MRFFSYVDVFRFTTYSAGVLKAEFGGLWQP